jgi:hypothetical protein
MNLFPQAEYVLFEPLPAHSEALDHVAVSCSPNVTVVKKAVGGSTGHAHLLFDPEDIYSGVLHPEQNKKQWKWNSSLWIAALKDLVRPDLTF